MCILTSKKISILSEMYFTMESIPWIYSVSRDHLDMVRLENPWWVLQSSKGIYEELNIITLISDGILSMSCGERDVEGIEVKEKRKKLLRENFIDQDRSLPLNQPYTTLYRWTLAKLTKSRSLICPRLPKKESTTVQTCL